MTKKTPEIPDARAVALSLLDDILLRNHPMDQAFDRSADLGRLEGRDRAFARLLVMTVLRRLGQLDFTINYFLKRDPKGGKGRLLRQLLRLGAAQLLFLGTAPHAAVSSTVAACDRLRLSNFKGVVNAVMRRMVTEGEGRLAKQDPERLNTPAWLWEALCAAHGEDAARAAAHAHLGESDPPLDLTPRGPAEALAERIDGATVTGLGGLRMASGGDVGQLPGFEEGEWWVQDAAAALAVPLLGDVADQQVIDLCAAPGGKTLQLAAAGARVTALDRSRARLGRLRENLERTGLEADVVEGDAERGRPETPADAVLLDAPCSATGTIRRHPDLPHLKGHEDVTRLAALQARLLSASLEMLKPGGRLLYVTCSLQPEEGEDQARWFAKSGLGVEADPITADELPGLPEALTPEGWLRTLPGFWPDRGGMDGFFMARFRKA